jgi:hypothetical protein
MTTTDAETVIDRQPQDPPANLTDAETVTDRHPHDPPANLTDVETVTDSHGAWLSTREAQHVLDVSERTLYRRIARGQYARRVRTDGQTEVWVPSARSTATDTGSSSGSPTEQVERSLQLVDRFGQAVAQQIVPLVQELATTRQQLITLAQENGRLSARVAELEQRLPVTDTVTVNDMLAPTPPPRPWRRFWRRFWRW